MTEITAEEAGEEDTEEALRGADPLEVTPKSFNPLSPLSKFQERLNQTYNFLIVEIWAFAPSPLILLISHSTV